VSDKVSGNGLGICPPYSIGWYCVVAGATLLKGKNDHADVWLPDGAFNTLPRMYGWTGKPNEGSREEKPDCRYQDYGKRSRSRGIMDYRVADTGIWAKVDGTSIYERMFLASGRKFSTRASQKKTGQLIMLKYAQGSRVMKMKPEAIFPCFTSLRTARNSGALSAACA